MKHIRWIFLFVVLCQINGQDVKKYLTIIQKGGIREVRGKLPELISKYPNNPGILYLKALTTVDGESAIKQYRAFVENFSDSPYSDDAVMKIGEYFYSLGLYSQASVQLRSVSTNYPDSEHIQRSVDLLVKSYNATGEVDSARFYLTLFKTKYSFLDIDQYNIHGIEERKKVSQKIFVKEPIVRPISGTGAWVVQVGAFRKYSNAKRLKINLNQNGYKVMVEEIIANRTRLHVVRVVRYSSREDANQVGVELKNKFGLDFRVLKKPEK